MKPSLIMPISCKGAGPAIDERLLGPILFFGGEGLNVGENVDQYRHVECTQGLARMFSQGHRIL